MKQDLMPDTTQWKIRVRHERLTWKLRPVWWRPLNSKATGCNIFRNSKRDHPETNPEGNKKACLHDLSCLRTAHQRSPEILLPWYQILLRIRLDIIVCCFFKMFCDVVWVAEHSSEQEIISKNRFDLRSNLEIITD